MGNAFLELIGSWGTLCSFSVASILSTIADDRVIEPLISALLSSDWVVRMHAAQAIGRLGNPQGIETLILLLQDKVPTVRDTAIAALKTMGELAIPPLIESLRHSDWRVRLRITEALGILGSKAATQPLLDRLANDPDTAVRQDAARALGNIGDQEAFEGLKKAIGNPRLEVEAIRALGKIKDKRAAPILFSLIAELNPDDYANRTPACEDNRYEQDLARVEEAIRALGHIKIDEAIPVLIKALQSTLVRQEAAEALLAFGKTAIKPLVTQLKKEQDDNIQFYIKETLAKLGWSPNRIRL